MKKFILILAFAVNAFAIKAQTWTQIPVPSNKKLLTIDFPSNMVGYIGGEDSTLLKSIDGGFSWQGVIMSGVTWFLGGTSIQKIRFTSELVGYMTVGPYGGTYKTIDGGSTWTPLVLSNGLCYNDGLFFFDENNGFIGGTGCFQGEMIDKMQAGILSGATLNAASFGNSSLIVDIDFYNANLGLAAASGGRIYRTIDGGANWDSISVYGFPLNSVAFVNDTLCYAGYSLGGSGFGLLQSLDGGLTWAEDFSAATFFYPDFHGIHVDGLNKVFVGAYSSGSSTGLIFESDSIGQWNYWGVDQGIYALSSTHDSIVFGVGDSGYVVVNHSIPTGRINSASKEELMEIYPNPFSESFTFQLDGKNESNFSLELFDVQGRLVKSTTSVIQNPFVLETGEIPRGIYQLRIIMDDGSMLLKKVVKQ
jgi:hypothetical protein